MWQRSYKLLDKSEAAIISAIEIYNKPDFKYREETFALLALNAWELLLKAKLLRDNKNNPRSIYQFERRVNKDGTPSAKEFLKRNRSGNAQTISLGRAIAVLDGNPSTRLNPQIKTNLDALTEIRDNAAHYLNACPQLSKQVLEIGTAAIRNYITLLTAWFDRNLSQYSLFLMPLGFFGSSNTATAISLSRDEKQLMAFLAKLAQESGEDNSDYHVSLTVNLSFQRSKNDSFTDVFVTSDPTALRVNVTEEDIRKSYPWDYEALTDRLSARYIDFKANQKYHDIRKSLIALPMYVKSRFLDPDNPRSAKKDFYNPNILQMFDRHYTRK